MRLLALTLLLSLACAKGKHVPTWTEDAEKVVQENCNGCHQLGGIAPLTLDSYLKARIHGADMMRQIELGNMPPWPPRGGTGMTLLHERSLSDAEFQILEDWYAGGMLQGPASAHQDRPPKVAPMEDDLDVKMAEPYLPDNSGTDDYRCFIIDPGVTVSQMITGYQVHPGAAGNVHHVILYEVLDQGNLLTQLQALDDADPGPGYTCFGGPMIDAAVDFNSLPPIRFVGGWAPGQGATFMPLHTGIGLEPGARLLMQVHYNLLNGRNVDQTSMSLQLKPRATSPDLIEALMVPMLDDNFRIDANNPDYKDSEEYLLPDWVPPFTIFTVYPHMHLLGKQISLSVRQGGALKTLIEIPHWDFHWQGSYELATPVKMSPGDSLRIDCAWDNSPAHQPEIHGVKGTPRNVRWGEKTTDEMCLGFLYVTF